MRKQLFEYIKSDLYRYAGAVSFSNFIKYYGRSEGFKFSVWLRACHFARQKKVTKYTLLPLCRLFYLHYKYKFGYDIPYDKEIGKGLLIFHIGGIVFCPEKAGENVTLSQNTTVGMRIVEGKKRYPIIGNNVYLAPGCAVIGGITVGDNVAVGTNAVVTRDIGDKAVVVGIPGKVVSYKGSGKYINNPVQN